MGLVRGFWCGFSVGIAGDSALGLAWEFRPEISGGSGVCLVWGSGVGLVWSGRGVLLSVEPGNFRGFRCGFSVGVPVGV